jgi:xanthine dehydrogenase YagS FAD-binding subunit
MKPFSMYRPSNIDDAIRILSSHGTDAAVFAGGTDLLIRLKNRQAAAPKYLVDIKKIADLSFIRQTTDGGLSIGSLTTLSAIAESKLLPESLSILKHTIEEISSPELRNQATIGGELLQEVWCQYLRGDYPCWRNGGYICYGAIGDNSYYHSAMGGRLCYAVYPADAATTLIALDARVKVVGPFGEKEMTVEELIPGDVVVDGRVQSHVLRFNEILTEVIIPPPKAGMKVFFEKTRPRGVWDFAQAEVAVLLQMSGSRIDDARVVFGGIAAKPWRETTVEQFLTGKQLSEELAPQATSVALSGAAPLKYNAHKIEMAKGLLAAAVTTLSAENDVTGRNSPT